MGIYTDKNMSQNCYQLKGTKNSTLTRNQRECKFYIPCQVFEFFGEVSWLWSLAKVIRQKMSPCPCVKFFNRNCDNYKMHFASSKHLDLLFAVCTGLKNKRFAMSYEKLHINSTYKKWEYMQCSKYHSWPLM